jgi:GNAT superfamily N-acetyltransferase
MITVQPSTITALRTSPEITALLAEYAGEAAIAGLPTPTARWDAYAALELAGLLYVFTATDDGKLVGFINVLVAPHTHYVQPLATSESFFVTRTHRAGGVALRLLALAEKKAAEFRCESLLVSAPSGGKLAEVLPRLGYAETNRVFFKQVSP